MISHVNLSRKFSPFMETWNDMGFDPNQLIGKYHLKRPINMANRGLLQL